MDFTSESTLTIVSPNSLCRACMGNTGDMHQIFLFSSGTMERTLPEIITYVTGIKVEENDGLPDKICDQCISLAKTALFFKDQCHQADANFRKLIDSSFLEIKNESDAIIKSEKDIGRCMLNDFENDVQAKDSSMDSSECYLMDNQVKAIYQCALCRDSFQLCNELKEHIKNVHQDYVKKIKSDKRIKLEYGCETCSQMFKSKKILIAHCEKCENKNSKKNKDKNVKEELADSDSDTPLAESMRFDDHNTSDTFEPFEAEEDTNSCNDLKEDEEPENGLETNETIPLIQEKIKKSKNYTCEECNISFVWKLFNNHMKTVHNKHKNRKKKKGTHKLVALLEGLQDSNTEGSWMNEPVNNVAEEVALPPVTITFSCTFCERKFMKSSALSLHLKKHEKQRNEIHICDICKREFKRQAHLENHILTHSLDKGFKCSLCPKAYTREFKRQAHLDNHILTHSMDKGFKCSLCPKAFARQESLSVHTSNHQAGAKKHQCNYCEKGFNMLSTLKDHIRTHTGEKPFLCSICGRGFSQSTNLKEHVRRHQGYKPFNCIYCDQTFVSKGELEAHSRKHSGAHPFVCDECGGGFTTSSSLVKHKRIHTGERPYQCDFCPMRFTALGTLKNHRRTHTGEKPYKCTSCEKAFAQKNDLVSHTRTHTGERPYVCSICGHAFRQSSALKTHFKIHGGAPQEIVGLDMTALKTHDGTSQELVGLDMTAIKVHESMQVSISLLTKSPMDESSSSMHLMTPKSESSHQ